MMKKVGLAVAAILVVAVLIYGVVNFVTATCPVVGIGIAVLAFAVFSIYMDSKENKKKRNSRKARK